MAPGYVLVEGMRAGTRIEGVPLTLRKIERYPVRDATADQPAVWTTVEFDFPDDDAERLAEALAGVLDERGGWYSPVERTKSHARGAALSVFPLRGPAESPTVRDVRESTALLTGLLLPR